MKKYIIILSLLHFFNSKNAISQISWGEGSYLFKLAKLSIEVNYLDSFYILTNRLIVDGNKKILVKKEIEFKDYFSKGRIELADYDGDIFLTKIVMWRDVIFAPNDYGRLYGVLFDSSGNLLKRKNPYVELKPGDSIITKIKLNNIYPLEQGSYFIYSRVRVKVGRKEYYVYSEPVNFRVYNLPPMSAKFHY